MVFQASTALPPALMVLGVTVMVAVGAGEVASGGGGGGGGTGWWQPAINVSVATAMSEAKCLCCRVLTMFSSVSFSFQGCR